MGLLGTILARVAAFAVAFLSRTGYAGLFLLMVGESMLLPIPSEAVMPFAGYLVATGRMTWAGAILASSAGSLVGSWAGYAMGRFGLLPLVQRYGRYVLVQPHHVGRAQDFFAARGAVAVFLCRFVPGVRHVSSIPAGSARMPLAPFSLATVLGATAWNAVLLYVGYKVGQNAGAIAHYKHLLDLAGAALLLLVVAYVWYEVRKARQATSEAVVAESLGGR